jgi:hypothetical protein
MIPNCRKVCKTFVHKIYKLLPLRDPPKFTQIGIFWSENIPSGNPYRNKTCAGVQRLVEPLLGWCKTLLA